MSLYTSNEVLIAQWCKSFVAWKGAFKQSKAECIKIRLLSDGCSGEWTRELSMG